MLSTDGSFSSSRARCSAAVREGAITSIVQGDVSALATLVNGIETSLTVALGDIAANASGLADTQADVNANAAAITQTQADVGLIEGELASTVSRASYLSSSIDAIDTEQVAGNATVQALADHLGKRQNRSLIYIEEQTRTTEDAALALRLDTVQAQVEDANAAITQQQAVSATADAALASDIAAIQTSLTLAQSGITANADAITAVELSVSANDGEIASLATQLIGVEATAVAADGKADAVSADGLFAVTASASPSQGAQSEVLLAARASVGGQVAEAAIGLTAYNDGGTLKSDVLIKAGGRILLVDSNDDIKGLIALDGAGRFVIDSGVFRQSIAESFTTPNGKVKLGELAPGVEGLVISR